MVSGEDQESNAPKSAWNIPIVDADISVIMATSHESWPPLSPSPSFTVPLYVPAMVPPPHIDVPGYAFAPAPGSFLRVPAMNPTVNSSNGRPNIEQGGHLNQGWHHQRPFPSSANMPMQQGLGPWPYITAPFYDPHQGYMFGPNFPGSGPQWCAPMAPPGSIRGPRPQQFVPYAVNTVPKSLPPETIALRTRIVKQIDYYFSDENLQHDHYLISFMNDQGWVPISTVAGFKRVKRMTRDIPFILDALQSSSTVEVQGDNIRKRNDWLKWIQVSLLDSGSLVAQIQQRQLVEDATNSFEIAAENASLREHIQSNTNTLQASHMNKEQDTESRHSIDKSLATSEDNESGDVLADISNDFSITFMLDEEIELVQKMLKKTELSFTKRLKKRTQSTRPIAN
ncbi:PREDICTED: la-related protein 1A-like [Lupinus angustifolius]|uniref:la-related protein 1A-like n=1 Tax=Lupinus angustifolius TaxID=3871 RepID=UPI00092E6E7D|nr:PREDICTED: la-related protein 1A-like [Lupinus angustifolius]